MAQGHYFTAWQVSSCPEAGENWGVKSRESAHSFTGWVLDFWFPTVGTAGAMAAKWSKAIGVNIKVRPDRECGGLLKVSVPVQASSY